MSTYQPMYPEIILGSPGCGKTTALLDILDEELSNGTDPKRIGFVTFTRKAAHEAVDRSCTRFGFSRADLPYFRTLHSLCFWALGLSPNDVLERNRLIEFGDWIGLKITGTFSMDEGATFGFTSGDRILFMENLARIRCRPLREQYDDDCDGLSWAEVDRVARGLVEFKRAKTLVDYTDMLTQVCASSWSPKLEVLLVDESQDLSKLQWLLVEKLASTVRRVVVAGDDDQAIYQWAGAALDHFVALPGTTRVLDQSWRVPKTIQTVAHSLISRIEHRRPKEWNSRDAVGSIERVTFGSGLDYGGDDVLILARNNHILHNQVVPDLHQSGVIFEWRGHSSVRPSVLEAIVNWEKLRKGEAILVEEAVKIYEQMSVGRGVRRGYKKLPGFEMQTPVDMQTLRSTGGLILDTIWHDALDRISTDERMYLLRALRFGERLTRRPRIRVSTIHGAKGGEASHIILFRDMAYRTWEEMRRAEDNERRVWYVAITRAKEKLTIVAPRTRMNYDI